MVCMLRLAEESWLLSEVFARVLCCCNTIIGGQCCAWQDWCTGIVTGCVCAM
jgi:hypothetical protein